jgi:hypothetical protein
MRQVKVIGKKSEFVDLTEEEAAFREKRSSDQKEIQDALSRVDARLIGYGPIGESLDKLWHSIDNGDFGPQAKVGEFYTSIKSVKDANPLLAGDNEIHEEYKDK